MKLSSFQLEELELIKELYKARNERYIPVLLTLTNVEEETVRDLKNSGAKVEYVFKELNIIDASLPINKLGKILEKGYVENYSWPRIVKPTSDYPFFGMGIILPPLSIDYKTLRAKQKTRQKNLNFKNLQKI